MKTTTPILAALATLALPLAVAHAQPLGTPLPASAPPLIAPPDDARLVGSSSLDEIRALPELGAGSLEAARPAREKLVGVAGVDRVFTTDRSFADTVGYFDSHLRHGGYHSRGRVERAGATAWIVRRPDGSIAEVAVRNTTPTTIEIVEAASDGVDMPQN